MQSSPMNAPASWAAAGSGAVAACVATAPVGLHRHPVAAAESSFFSPRPLPCFLLFPRALDNSSHGDDQLLHYPPLDQSTPA